MEVTVNENQQLFVISTGSGYSCLGFDNLFRTAEELAARLIAAGKEVVKPLAYQMGTLEQYAQYRTLLAGYAELRDKRTWFETDTPVKVRRVLEDCRQDDCEVRIFYGDPATGLDSMEEYDTVGTIGRTGGTMKSLILVPKLDCGGPIISTSRIVKIVDVGSGIALYKHPKYHYPELSLVYAEGAEYPHQVLGKETKVNYANFKSLEEAAHWIAFITGKCHVSPTQ